MGLLSEKDARALRWLLARRLVGRVTIEHFTRPGGKPLAAPGDGDTGHEAATLLAEVAGLSEKIRLQVHDFLAEAEAATAAGIDRIPAIVLKGLARGRVRYFGVPGGYEFAAFLEQLIDVGNGATNLAERTKRALRGLAREVSIETCRLRSGWSPLPVAASRVRSRRQRPSSSLRNS